MREGRPWRFPPLAAMLSRTIRRSRNELPRGLAEEAAVEADAPDAEAAAIVELEPAPVEPAESKASAQARRGSAVEQIIPPPPAVDSAATVAPPAAAAPATSSEQPMENKATEEAPAENVA